MQMHNINLTQLMTAKINWCPFMIREGDLIELSAYGKKIDSIKQHRNDVGIVLNTWHSGTSIYAKWTRCGFVWLNLRDVKKVYAKKLQKP